MYKILFSVKGLISVVLVIQIILTDKKNTTEVVDSQDIKNLSIIYKSCFKA